MGSNRHQIIGRLGADPALKTSGASGRTWTGFWVATNETWKDRQGNKRTHTEWHRVTCWGRRADTVVKYLRKGSEALFAGPARTREYTDQETGEVRRIKEIQV